MYNNKADLQSKTKHSDTMNGPLESMSCGKTLTKLDDRIMNA